MYLIQSIRTQAKGREASKIKVPGKERSCNSVHYKRETRQKLFSFGSQTPSERHVAGDVWGNRIGGRHARRLPRRALKTLRVVLCIQIALGTTLCCCEVAHPGDLGSLSCLGQWHHMQTWRATLRETETWKCLGWLLPTHDNSSPLLRWQLQEDWLLRQHQGWPFLVQNR